MATSIRKGWTRGPFGYRDAQLEGADFTAALTLFVGGIPALLVGADLASRGVGFSQLILAAPIGALLGAAIVGLMGRKASASGAPSVYLSRPAFGSLGAVPLTLVRLVLTVAWGAVILSVSGDWLTAAVATMGITLPDVVGPALVAVLGTLLLTAGPAWMVHAFLRRRLFAISAIVVVVAAWRVLDGTAGEQGQPIIGGFLTSVDEIFGLALLWLTAGGDIGGYGHREEDTATGMAYGFAVASLVFVLGGASIAAQLGGFPVDLTVLGAGLVGGVIALIWVPLMETDGFGGLAASSGFALESLVPAIPPFLLAMLAAAGSTVAAVLIPLEQLRSWAALATVLFAPAVGVILADAYVLRPGSYMADHLYLWRGEYGLLNVAGLLSWVVGALAALWIRPLGPPIVRDAITPFFGSGHPGLPVLLIGLVGAGILYLGLGWLVLRRRAGVYRLRGV
jgi:purine-cytosine permease-like protein